MYDVAEVFDCVPVHVVLVLVTIDLVLSSDECNTFAGILYTWNFYSSVAQSTLS